MRATVRAAGITSKRRTRTGVVAARVGALTLSLGVAALAGAFFAGPVSAETNGAAEDPPCPLPAPLCASPDPTPSDTGEPEPTDTGEPSPTSKPSNVVTRPGGGGGNGGGGGSNNGGSNSGGSNTGGSNSGPSLPTTGAEAGLIAGTGAALVGGGAALMLVARRRKAAAADDEN